MKIGIPKEIKDHEYRVSLTPSGAKALVAAGHQVVVQQQAGAAIGFADKDYENAGATIVGSAQEAFASDLIVKVKEPQPSECGMLKEGSIFFGYLHLASSAQLAASLMSGGSTAIGYETVTDRMNRLPLLTPMSQIAGRIAIQEGSSGLTLPNGGCGTLLSGAVGVKSARVTVIGAGIAGSNAARLAHAMGAEVTVLDVNPDALSVLEIEGMQTCYSNPESLEAGLTDSDLVVCATLIPGKHAPKLISRDMVKNMKKGSVIVDISIDQGGSAETSRPTTHSSPFYVEEGVVHYCVTNMPALVSRTATLALTHATLPFVLKIANLGLDAAVEEDSGLKGGLQVRAGRITHPAVAEALGT